MRERLANLLRSIVNRLSDTDRQHHLYFVRQMNEYIGQTERYIIDLEARIGNQEALVELREKHGRFDTKPLRNAGAWG